MHVLKLKGMVMTAYVMTVIWKGQAIHGGEGGADVLMRGDSSSEVKWVINCGGGGGEVTSRSMMRIMGVFDCIS